MATGWDWEPVRDPVLVVKLLLKIAIVSQNLFPIAIWFLSQQEWVGVPEPVQHPLSPNWQKRAAFSLLGS